MLCGRPRPLSREDPTEKPAGGPRQVDFRAVTRENMITGVDLMNWIVVETSRDAGNALDFVNMYCSVFVTWGSEWKGWPSTS